MLPSFDPDTGRLPAGEHVASFEDLLDRFGWNAHRRRLLDGFAEACELLAAAGCRTVWLNGSFVTAKDEPGDFDACWDTADVDLDALEPVLLDLSNHREAQRARFGGELFPNVVENESGLAFTEFFQHERDGSRKGIVILHLPTRSSE